jgi:hypothetical protein
MQHWVRVEDGTCYRIASREGLLCAESGGSAGMNNPELAVANNIADSFLYGPSDMS